MLLGQRGALQPGTLEARHHHGALGVRGAVLAPPLVAQHRGRARRHEGAMQLGGVDAQVVEGGGGADDEDLPLQFVGPEWLPRMRCSADVH